MTPSRKIIAWRDLSKEPFRFFFVLATLSAIAGVLLWPLHLQGIILTYPGQVHARIMTHCFYGGFIIGFLGTALPRMLSVKPLSFPSLGAILLLYLCMLGFYLAGFPMRGDSVLLILICLLLILFSMRFAQRRDMPPPGFILMAFGFLSLLSGTVLSLLSERLNPFLLALQHLLSFQGFVLLPIMGIGPFILPRFFGMESTHDLPESRSGVPAWKKKALIAFSAGLLIFVSFALESLGATHGFYWLRIGSALRFLVVTAYLLQEARVHLGPGRKTIPIILRIGLALIPIGFLMTTLLVVNRIALFHIDFAGGFALVTICVAARVVFGHSGNQKRLSARNGLIITAATLMFLAMLTRIIADFKPEVMASHYTYGAICWAVGLAFWAVPVLRHVLEKDPED